MSTCKFLIVDETEKKNLLPQMKIDFSVKKIVRITYETNNIEALPSVDWSEFSQNHAYLFQQLHDLNHHALISLYFFTGNPQNSIWTLKNSSTLAKFFEINSNEFLAHVDEVKNLNQIESTFSKVKYSYDAAEDLLEDAMIDDLGGYLGRASDLSSLHNQTHKSKIAAAQLERHCLARYQLSISQDWS